MYGLTGHALDLCMHEKDNTLNQLMFDQISVNIFPPGEQECGAQFKYHMHFVFSKSHVLLSTDMEIF